jgi:hypothetical protein
MLALNALLDDAMMEITLLTACSTFYVPVAIDDIQAMSYKHRFVIILKHLSVKSIFPIRYHLMSIANLFSTNK